jgi:hypothetical protein
LTSRNEPFCSLCVSSGLSESCLARWRAAHPRRHLSGFNHEEADGAGTKKDFVNHVRISRKETQESRFWLAMISAADLLQDPEVQALSQDADELVRIPSSIITNATRG